MCHCCHCTFSTHIVFQFAFQALSPVGRCKSFEASADGYGRGEGVAALVLRRLQPARLTDVSTGDNIYAAIRGSSINQGGRSSGLTAPNGPAQTALIRTALQSVGLSAARLRVISVHGTGTPLGDPIEVGALSQALPKNGHKVTKNDAPVTLLSNKSIFGHTEGTAGIAGLLLSVATLQNQAVPQVMHLRSINPYVSTAMEDWSTTPNAVFARALRQTAPTIQREGNLVAGTSSFGMSGVNAHMLVSTTGDGMQDTKSIVSDGFICVRTTFVVILPTPNPVPTHQNHLQQIVPVWQRSRHHVLVRPHALLQCVSTSTNSLTYSFSPGTSTAFLFDYQLCGKVLLPAAAFLEMSAAIAVTCLENAAPVLHTALAHVSLSTLIDLPDEASLPVIDFSVSIRTGQLIAACSKKSSDKTCFTACILKTASVPSKAAADTSRTPQMSHLTVR